MGCCHSREQKTTEEDANYSKGKQHQYHASLAQKSTNVTGSKKRLQKLLQEARHTIEQTEKARHEEKARYHDWANTADKHYKHELQNAREKINETEKRRAEYEQKYKEIEKQATSKHMEETSNLKREIQQLRYEKDSLLSSFSAETSELKREIQNLKDEKDLLLSRLSSVAAARLTDGNADIADLSDENRPTKLSEKYSEMYDNEWTEAYDILTREGKQSDQEACEILATAFCVIRILFLLHDTHYNYNN